MKKLNWIPALVLTAVAVPSVLAAGLLPALWLIAGPVVLVTVVFRLVLHYQCWGVLPPGKRRTSPGKAVGFLFIPFFNVYWVFQSYAGLAEDLGKATGARGPTGLGIARGILGVCGCALLPVPVVGAAIHIALFVIWILYTKRIVEMAGKCEGARAGAPAGAVPPLVAA